MAVSPDCTNCKKIGTSKCKKKNANDKVCIYWTGDLHIIKWQNEMLAQNGNTEFFRRNQYGNHQ